MVDCADRPGPRERCVTACSSRHFNCRSEIDGPHFSAILRRVVCKATIAAAGVEDLLAGKEVGGVRLHVVEKLLLPLLVHLREAMPFVTKAQCCFRLRAVGCGGATFTGQGVTH